MDVAGEEWTKPDQAGKEGSKRPGAFSGDVWWQISFLSPASQEIGCFCLADKECLGVSVVIITTSFWRRISICGWRPVNEELPVGPVKKGWYLSASISSMVWLIWKVRIVQFDHYYPLSVVEVATSEYLRG